MKRGMQILFGRPEENLRPDLQHDFTNADISVI